MVVGSRSVSHCTITGEIPQTFWSRNGWAVGSKTTLCGYSVKAMIALSSGTPSIDDERDCFAIHFYRIGQQAHSVGQALSRQ